MRVKISFVSALIALLFLAVLSLHFGAVTIPWREIWSSFWQSDSTFSFILTQNRLPRIVVAILAGSGLAVAGVLLQNVVRNPLASPDVIGVTKGAGLCAVIVLFLFPKAPYFVLPIAAIVGALLAFSLIVLLSKRMTIGPASFALIGVALGAVFQAGIQYMLIKFPTNINQALLWMSGSLWGRGWGEALYLLPWIVVLLPIAWAQYAKMNVIQLGDESSVGLGINIKRQRLWLMLLSVSLTGISVSAVGAIGFIGLVAPHIARLLVGSRYQLLIPLAALIGADLLLLSDVIGRVIIIPREVPVGIMSAIIGAPYFIYLLRRQRVRSMK